MIRPAVEDMGYDLVRVAVLGRGCPTVQVMADRRDGSLIKVEDCEVISHALSALLDVENPIPGAWNLEVSSAGIDRPLTRAKDWNRFSGHQAKVELGAPLISASGGPENGRKRFSGVVLRADEAYAHLQLDDGTDVALPMRDITKAKLTLTDELIKATAQPTNTEEPLSEL